MFHTFVLALYTLALLGLTVYSAQSLVLTALFVWGRGLARRAPPPPPPSAWPTVTLQLPLYNERYVATRLIDTVCALDYAPDRLQIQVLDDSTDDTTALVQDCVAGHQQRGINIQLLHRPARQGFKAGALAAGLAEATGEFIAIFDADFVPPPDFLKRTLPHLQADSGVGAVQARWGHLNGTASALTRAQALALDGHFVVEQTARSGAGLLFNFNGSAGVWRRACIVAAGGWQADTLSEDLDLSYRAQIAGWRLGYLPDLVAPAEVPPQLAGFKRQQYRWARGCIQVLRKLSGPLLTAPLTWGQKLGGFCHITAYLAYPLLLVALLCGLPLAWWGGALPTWLGVLSLAGLGPPLLYAVSQCATYRDWPVRLAFFPFLLGIGMGVMLNNTRAVWDGARTGPMEFARTPKFGGAAPRASAYQLRVSWLVLGEWALSLYAGVALFFAWERTPALVPLLALCAWGLGLVAVWSTWEVL